MDWSCAVGIELRSECVEVKRKSEKVSLIGTSGVWKFSAHTLHDKVKGLVKIWKPVFDVVDPSGTDFAPPD